VIDAHQSISYQLFVSFNIAPGHVRRRLLFARPIAAWLGEKLLFCACLSLFSV
jgi:hypothetical protein